MTKDGRPDAQNGKTSPPASPCADLPPGPTEPVRPTKKTCTPNCHCPTTPPPSETCFDKLIAAQAEELKKAELAQKFKGELEVLLKQATAARLAYTQDKYVDFQKRWEAADKEIVSAINIVTCNLDCWRCLIECEICPLLYEIKSLATEIDGDGTLIQQAHSLQDLQYWRQRNRDAKAAQFARFKGVLDAWANPAASIDAALQANDKVLKGIRSLEPADAVAQLFLKVIPLHLAIAPRGAPSQIKSEYMDLCCNDPHDQACCDKGVPDDCCGPDVGVLSVRMQEIVGPQAYIAQPDAYMDILCCLVQRRYQPAKDQLAQAESALAAINDEIVRKRADLDRRRKSILDDFKRNIVTPIDCAKYQPVNGGAGNGCGCADTPTPTPPSTPTIEPEADQDITPQAQS